MASSHLPWKSAPSVRPRLTPQLGVLAVLGVTVGGIPCGLIPVDAIIRFAAMTLSIHPCPRPPTRVPSHQVRAHDPCLGGGRHGPAGTGAREGPGIGQGPRVPELPEAGEWHRGTGVRGTVNTRPPPLLLGFSRALPSPGVSSSRCPQASTPPNDGTLHPLDPLVSQRGSHAGARGW